MRLFSGSLVTILLLCALALSARAAITMTDDEEVVVESHEVIDDDLIVWASYIRIDGLVKGDLIAFGSEIVVEGIVEEDLIAVGRSVYLNGRVSDDARIAAYAVALGEKARVGDDFFGLGYSLETKPGSAVGGTLHTASRQVLLAGQVVEAVLMRAGALELRGLTGGDVRAVVGGLEGVAHSNFVIDLALEIPNVPDGVNLGPGATIGGDLEYRSQQPAAVDAAARINGEVRHRDWRTSPDSPIEIPALGDDESRFSEALSQLAVLLVAGLLLAVMMPGWLRRRGESVRDGPATMLGWGIGALVFGGLASFAIGILGFLLVALALSAESGGLVGASIVAGVLLQLVLFGVFGLAVVFVAPALTSAGIGSALLARLQPRSDDPAPSLLDNMLLLAVGGVVYTALRAIPGLGWWIGACGTLVGLGALALWLREVSRDRD